MRRVTLRSLWEHKRRLVSTLMAIVLGVGFMSGTFILSTTLDQAAEDLFKDAAAEVDALVQGPPLAGGSVDGSQRASLDASEVATVRGIDGVAAAEPRVSTKGTGGTNRVLAPAGWPLGSSVGPGTIFESWIGDPRLTPYRIVAGRAPEADDEIALDQGSATSADATVGSVLTIVGQFGPQPYRLVGTFRAGIASTGTDTVSVDFTLAEVQRLAGLGDHIDGVFVKADPGISEDALVARLGAELHGVDVVTGDQARADLSRSSSADLRFFQAVLSVFGVVALLVGAFVISNTFSILVAQRSRELALLRALGASRLQVFGSVLTEAAMVAVVASGAGLLLGTYLATWINRGMRQLGLYLPTSDLVVRANTILLSLVMGILATLLAALMPAVRATRVPPVAALREVEADRAPSSVRRAAAGGVITTLGAYLCSAAWRDDGIGAAIPVTGLGAVLVMVGVVVLAPSVAGRAVGLPGPLLHRARGVTGRLATENAARSPRRTATTASSVVISVSLVVFVTAFAASAVESVRSDARRGFAGDFIITGAGGLTLPNGLLSTPISPSIVGAVRKVPGVDLAVAMGYTSARLTFADGATVTPFVSSIDRAGLGTVLLPRMASGDIGDLDDDGIVLDRVDARQHHVRIGDRVRYGVDSGPSVALRVVAISDDPNLLGHATVTRDRYAAVAPQVRDVQVGGTLEPGADLHQVLRGVRSAIAGSPSVWALSRQDFISDLTRQISSFVNVIYGLLALSVLISALGIANTLSLTIHERTRELGLLRALGMDRSGVRSSVRWEAVLIGVLGMAVGLVVGAAVSAAVVTSLRELGLVTFALPAGSVWIVGIVAVVLTLAASLRPARRAAAVSILAAIGAE